MMLTLTQIGLGQANTVFMAGLSKRPHGLPFGVI
jgi:hypothetical protein